MNKLQHNMNDVVMSEQRLAWTRRDVFLFLYLQSHGYFMSSEKHVMNVKVINPSVTLKACGPPLKLTSFQGAALSPHFEFLPLDQTELC